MGNMYLIRGLHNDLLKMYIECGFWGYVIWLILTLIYVPEKIKNKLGVRSATIYLALNIFAFITYLTDNTESYFVFQTILLTFPLVLKENRKEEEKNDY